MSIHGRMSIHAIAFDGDDTLWHNEGLFSMTQDRFRALLSDAVGADELDARLLATERENVAVYGYGVKGFTLSMIETAIEVTNGKVDADAISQILSFAKDQLSHPVELLPGVSGALDALAGRYRLLLITKGDLFDQESKIARSGLAERFDVIEVVAEKEPDIYRRVLQRNGIDPAGFLMIGNSVRSDVLPVLEVGGQAAHVPYHLTWELELAEPPYAHDGYWELDDISQVPALVATLDARDVTPHEGLGDGRVR
jgi:putative hydrolase of the HAD superfamily